MRTTPVIEVRASTDVAASPETVWKVLTDLGAYASWNPFIRHARGSLEVGGDVRVRVRPHFQIPLAFRARIVERDEARELRWRGNFGAAWLASGDHRFTITDLGDGRARFEQSETFGGLLTRLGARLLEREARRGFEAMNRALAFRAERAQLATSGEARASAARETS